MPSRRALLLAPLYDGSLFPPLPGGAELTRRLEACLKGRGGYEVKPVRGTIRRPDLRGRIRELADTEGEVLFYFYGHGVLRHPGVGVLATSDAEPDDEGVLMGEVIPQLYRSRAREVVVILDCCHAGAAAPVVEEAIKSAAETSAAGRVLLAGCAAHQQGWVEANEDQRKLGVFSWYVLAGLDGAASRGSPDVRGSSLGLYVTDEFRKWNQNPLFLPRETGDLRCVITTGFRPEESPPAKQQVLVLGVPFMPSQIFVGRRAEMETLQSILTGGPKPVAVSATIEGLGGIGKTELVIQLLRDPSIGQAFDTIVWLDGAGPLPPQWQKVGASLGLSLPALGPEALVETVACRLRERGRSLIVLDNAADWNPVARLVPLDMALLVTTRTRDFGGTSFRHLELDILEEEAARSFLVRISPRLQTDPALPRLVAALGGHALALEIAGGTINALDLSASDYLARLKNRQYTPEQVMNQIKYGKTVDECLTLTWDSLQRDTSRAMWRRASLFAPTSAHRELLRVSCRGDERTRDEIRYMSRRGYFDGGYEIFLWDDPDEFDKAYAELRSRNVFARVEGTQAERWAMHRLVREFGRARLKSGEFAAHALALAEWLRAPTLDLQAEAPHLVATILDSAKYVGEFRGMEGLRSPGREVYSRSPVLFDSSYFLQFIREELRDPRALTMLLDGLVDINDDVRRRPSGYSSAWVTFRRCWKGSPQPSTTQIPKFARPPGRPSSVMAASASSRSCGGPSSRPGPGHGWKRPAAWDSSENPPGKHSSGRWRFRTPMCGSRPRSPSESLVVLTAETSSSRRQRRRHSPPTGGGPFGLLGR